MGLDTVILFKAKDGFNFENELPPGFTVQSIPDHLSEEYPEATHELDTNYRYYGDGYERGPWPRIGAALMILFASMGIEKVWYGSDCTGPQEIQPEDVNKISLHYMLNGERPYRGIKQFITPTP